MNLNLAKLHKGQFMTLKQALFLSLELAQKGQGRVEPNPCVGAVLFNEEKNKLVSWGHHESYGGPHAEVNCLKEIESAEGLTLVVTLEPCSHFGKTSPCADLVISKKVSKLIYIEKDPNPLVFGKGLERIKSAGIEVESAPEEFRLEHSNMNDKFIYSFINKHSFVHLKWAQSANKKLGYKNESIKVTSKESQLDAHFLRAQSQMVVVGLETILQDDPRLNVRLKSYEKDLMVGVLDPELKLVDKLSDKKIFKMRPKGKVFLITNQKIKKKGVISVPEISTGQIDLNELRKITFKDHGVQSIFVEGGAQTLKSFIEQDVFNRISIYESNKSFNGNHSISVFKDKKSMDLFVSKELKLVSEKSIESDTFKDYKRS